MLLLLLLTNAFVLLPWAGAGRIIGGKKAKPHSRPYMAYLEIETDSDPISCGGFLIRPDAVLSAAHCVDMKGVKVTVTLGAHNIRRQEPSQQRIPVVKKVIHPKYSRKDGKNDIVLLKVWPNTSFLPEGSPPAHLPKLSTCSSCFAGSNPVFSVPDS
ncbi:granzyme B-like [Zonotrichia albicollis]|uniref:granzyme B-like n=1 Tax=Zonotrichia albicollis TaxID=44394 RepID=UPI003D810CB0